MRVEATAKVQGTDRLKRQMIMHAASSMRMKHHKNIVDAAVNTVKALARAGFAVKDMDFQYHDKNAFVRHLGTVVIKLKALPS